MVMKGVESHVDRYAPGSVATFIQDHQFSYVCEIPVNVAVTWVKKIFPDACIGHHVVAKDVTIDDNTDTSVMRNGWLNHLFIIIARDHGRSLAIVNSDGRFSLYQQDQTCD